MDNAEFLESMKQHSTEKILFGCLVCRIDRKRGDKFMTENAPDIDAGINVDQLERLIELAEKGLTAQTNPQIEKEQTK